MGKVAGVYRVLPDPSASRVSWLRVIDDSGEDYLYPWRLFLPLPVPLSLRRVFERRQGARS
jgi:hypothetical protein